MLLDLDTLLTSPDGAQSHPDNHSSLPADSPSVHTHSTTGHHKQTFDPPRFHPPSCPWPPNPWAYEEDPSQRPTEIIELHTNLSSDLAPRIPSPTSLQEVPLAKPRFYYQNIGYCSLSEAACGVLMEQFISGFRLVNGETFQIPMGGGRSVDFFVRGVLVEYHHLRLKVERKRFGDFGSREEYLEYSRELRRVRHNRHRREKLIKRTREKLSLNYFEKRRRIIDDHPIYGGTELVVASSLEDFYDQVILRFSEPRCPSLDHFRELFQSKVRLISEEGNFRFRK